MKKIILALLFIIQVISGNTQTPAELLYQYLSGYHSEKLYVSHDKPYYIVGETIWCKVYLVNEINYCARWQFNNIIPQISRNKITLLVYFPANPQFYLSIV